MTRFVKTTVNRSIGLVAFPADLRPSSWPDSSNAFSLEMPSLAKEWSIQVPMNSLTVPPQPRHETSGASADSKQTTTTNVHQQFDARPELPSSLFRSSLQRREVRPVRSIQAPHPPARTSSKEPPPIPPVSSLPFFARFRRNKQHDDGRSRR
jgi:hypothetical protein